VSVCAPPVGNNPIRQHDHVARLLLAVTTTRPKRVAVRLKASRSSTATLEDCDCWRSSAGIMRLGRVASTH
jgi:hypothetical protein